MSDLTPLDLDTVLERIAENEREPLSAADAYEAQTSQYAAKIYAVSQIAKCDSEPYAQQLAQTWLNENPV